MKHLIYSLLTVMLIACSAPQTRQEFVEKIRGGAGLSSYEQIVVNRSLDSIRSSLIKPLDSCLNATIQSYYTVGGGRTSNMNTVVYRTKLENSGNGKSALTMQASYSPSMGPTPPQNGFYEIAIDFESTGNKTTQVNFYIGRTGHDDIVQAFKSWIQGRTSDCPITKNAIIKQS